MAQQTAQQTGTVVQPGAAMNLITYLEKRSEDESATRAFDVAANQLDRVMAAKTEEEFWSATDYESQGGRDIEDLEQVVLSFTVHKSTGQFTAALGHYVMVSAQRMDNGESFIWNTGSPLIIGQLRWLEAKDMLPAEVVVKGADTPNGRVIKLRPVPKRAVTGKAE